MGKIKFSFEYGLDLEKDRVKWTLSRMNWYRRYGYEPILPKQPIDVEYNEADYKRIADEIQARYSEISPLIKKILRKNFGKTPEKIKIQLTKYGTWGSYNTPDRIVINISGKRDIHDWLRVITHETAHIMVEPYVRKYLKNDPREKERLVGKILHGSKEFNFIKTLSPSPEFRFMEKQMRGGNPNLNTGSKKRIKKLLGRDTIRKIREERKNYLRELKKEKPNKIKQFFSRKTIKLKIRQKGR